MITERTLRNWRKQALQPFDHELYGSTLEPCASLAKAYLEMKERILRLTQELLDQHLMRPKS